MILGTAHGYHGITLGLLMDILVQKVDPQHRSLKQFFHDKIAKSLDLDRYVYQMYYSVTAHIKETT